MYKPVSKRAQAKATCKYEMSNTIAKRARMLVDTRSCNDDFKPVLQALDEFENDELNIKRN